ncbi:hypothetical protein QE152_g31386 [Popillia japonica]|uniref:CCHC-type domain-containing protein n=1 Tax=Popillia japonica TaxID=7064 RepID=A0AAW1J1N6_POPJA
MVDLCDPVKPELKTHPSYEVRHLVAAGRRMRAGTSSSEDGSKPTTFRAKKHQPSERCEYCGRSNHIRQNCYFKSALCEEAPTLGEMRILRSLKPHPSKLLF